MLKSKLFFNYFKLLLLIILGISINACDNNQQIEKSLSPAKILVEIPQNIPQYPQAKLINFSASDHSQLIKILWQVNEDQEKIKTYYQNQLKQDQWEIIAPFNSTQADTNKNVLIATKDNSKLTVSIIKNNPTQFSLEYTKTQTNLAQNDSIVIENTPIPTSTSPSSPTPKVTPKVTPTPTETPNNNQSSAQTFDDLTEIPENFQQYINDLNELEIFTNNDIIDNKFKPNEPIKKRDFVRWLVQTNNKIYADNPPKQIRLDSQSSELAFRDILPTDPDFKYIQALAETGIILSPLTGENQPDLFYPDQPLTREELILWKVPFDVRQALPKADLKLIEESWGFQDTAKINPQILNAVYADFQNKKYSNIERIFNFTKLFQPQKTVTRAEAVASLWYFGNENEGISIKDYLAKEKK